MNAIQIHLMINHIPVIGMLFVAGLFGYGLWYKNHAAQQWGLRLFVFLALFTLPVFFSGEEAENLMENNPTLSEQLVEAHEEAAETARIGMALLGFLALGGLWGFRKRSHYPAIFRASALVLCVINILLMANTAHLGGKIRHPELNAAFSGEQDRADH